MKNMYTRTFWSRMALVVLAFLLLAGCQKPDPDPEPPTPPIVDTDTLPTNKFVGTWVLCATNDINSEPPATCDLADATTDTLMFVDDSTLILHHEANTINFFYEFTEHYLIRYHYDNSTPEPNGSNLYFFRENDEELVLRGTIYPFFYKKNLCFRRLTQD